MKRLVVLSLVVACASQPPPPPKRVAIAPPAARAAPRPVPLALPPPDECAGFEARTKSAIGAALAKRPEERYLGEEEVHSPVGFCRGPWRVEMPDDSGLTTRADVAFAVEAKFRVVHVDRSGRRAEHVMKQTLDDYGWREAPPEPVVFDFDGDGEPEIYIELHETGDEGHVARQIELLTFKGGNIAPYAPASGFDVAGTKDVDGDGRPDLLVTAGYVDTLEGCWAGFPYDQPPARFVAHSKADGTFAIDDDAAKNYARTWCPSEPASIGDSAAAICARLWARTPSDVAREKRRVVASCAPGFCERETKHLPQPPNSSPDCERRQAWFAREPPLVF